MTDALSWHPAPRSGIPDRGWMTCRPRVTKGDLAVSDDRWGRVVEWSQRHGPSRLRLPSVRTMLEGRRSVYRRRLCRREAARPGILYNERGFQRRSGGRRVCRERRAGPSRAREVHGVGDEGGQSEGGLGSPAPCCGKPSRSRSKARRRQPISRPCTRSRTGVVRQPHFVTLLADGRRHRRRMWQAVGRRTGALRNGSEAGPRPSSRDRPV